MDPDNRDHAAAQRLRARGGWYSVSRTAGCKTEESLNKIMGELDSIPEDSAARRIGRAAEYADQELTLAQYLYRLAADYFEDRYASEYACDISADEETEVSDEPEGMIWDLTDGRLTISGRGPMPDYVTTVPPWQEQKASIETVVIEDMRSQRLISNHKTLCCSRAAKTAFSFVH